jgi:hypothetical protein
MARFFVCGPIVDNLPLSRYLLSWVHGRTDRTADLSHAVNDVAGSLSNARPNSRASQQSHSTRCDRYSLVSYQRLAYFPGLGNKGLNETAPSAPKLVNHLPKGHSIAKSHQGRSRIASSRACSANTLSKCSRPSCGRRVVVADESCAHFFSSLPIMWGQRSPTALKKIPF